MQASTEPTPLFSLFPLLCAADYLIVGVGGDAVNESIEQCERDKADGSGYKKECGEIEIERKEYSADYYGSEYHMQTRSRERQEEYREQLRIYALSYLFLRHADLLHYLKARLILIALRDLLIVDYQHSRKDEHRKL